MVKNILCAEVFHKCHVIPFRAKNLEEKQESKKQKKKSGITSETVGPTSRVASLHDAIEF